MICSSHMCDVYLGKSCYDVERRRLSIPLPVTNPSSGPDYNGWDSSCEFERAPVREEKLTVIGDVKFYVPDVTVSNS